MTTYNYGQWVRLPKQFGYAEGIVKACNPIADVCQVEVIGIKGEITLPIEWLTPIDAPSADFSAPKFNVDASGHPVTVYNEVDRAMVTHYIKMVEQGESDKVCWCPWTPMEVDGKKGRLRSGEHPQCRVHTKEGYLYGFFEFLWENVKLARQDISERPESLTKGIVDIDPSNFPIPKELLDGYIEDALREDKLRAKVRWLE